MRLPLGIALFLAVSAAGCSWSPLPGTRQVAADDFELPDTGPPRFPSGQGPRIAVDEAHNNYHRIGGRYRAFASLLRRDGYRVAALEDSFTAATLAGIDLLVIANAFSKEGESDWSLPTYSAFTADEMQALQQWVAAGGCLMLIADHMPIPGHAAELAARFGVLFHNGFAYDAEGRSQLTFSRANGLLADHPITTSTGRAVPFVTTFTGQAFRMRPGVPAEPLLTLPTGSYLLLPKVAWQFTAATPRIPADGLLQGAVLRHGRGRVAVFGEAAAFSAQVQIGPRGERRAMGMSHTRAPHNARFLLNVIAWLLPEKGTTWPRMH